MTFGNDLFFRKRFNAANIDDQKLLLHELVHSSQVLGFGGESNFACEYGEEYASGGFSYRNNKLEKDAYALADSVYP